MIEKYLIRFCALEVQVLVKRMHERPEDFDYGNKWRDLAEVRDGFTWAERMVLDREWASFKKNQKRRELLSLITKEVLDPTPKNQWGTRTLSNFQALQGQSIASMTTAQLRAHMNAHMTDPRALYQGNNNV